MRVLCWLSVVIFSVGSALQAGSAKLVTSETLGPRSEARAGFYVSVLGDPAPSIMGVNAAYNLSYNWRANAGVGWLPLFIEDDAYTLGAGIKYLFLRDSRITPVVGAGVALVRGEMRNLGALFNAISRRNDPAPVLNAVCGQFALGADWQTGIGLDVGLGGHIVFSSGAAIAPYLNLGWFF